MSIITTPSTSAAAAALHPDNAVTWYNHNKVVDRPRVASRSGSRGDRGKKQMFELTTASASTSGSGNLAGIGWSSASTSGGRSSQARNASETSETSSAARHMRGAHNYIFGDRYPGSTAGSRSASSAGGDSHRSMGVDSSLYSSLGSPHRSSQLGAAFDPTSRSINRSHRKFAWYSNAQSDGSLYMTSVARSRSRGGDAGDDATSLAGGSSGDLEVGSHRNSSATRRRHLSSSVAGVDADAAGSGSSAINRYRSPSASRRGRSVTPPPSFLNLGHSPSALDGGTSSRPGSRRSHSGRRRRIFGTSPSTTSGRRSTVEGLETRASMQIFDDSGMWVVAEQKRHFPGRANTQTPNTAEGEGKGSSGGRKRTFYNSKYNPASPFSHPRNKNDVNGLPKTSRFCGFPARTQMTGTTEPGWSSVTPQRQRGSGIRTATPTPGRSVASSTSMTFSRTMDHSFATAHHHHHQQHHNASSPSSGIRTRTPPSRSGSTYRTTDHLVWA